MSLPALDRGKRPELAVPVRLAPDAASNPDPIAIRCEGLWKVYCDSPARQAAIIREQATRSQAMAEGAMIAVRNVSFEVRRGEIFCIMGLSGSGKSTLLRHINRLIEPSAGRVFVDGQDILGCNARQLRALRARTIGMVFQNVALMPHKSVRDNVAYGLKVQGVPRARRNRIAEEKLDLVQLSGWGHRYPHELSGGMQQRVGLARALASDPPALLLDEPFSALDPLIRTQLQSEFNKLSRAIGKTAIFITHDFDEAMEVGDRIAIMKDGEFVQVGRPEEIILNPASHYVAQFVKRGASLRLIRAKDIMRRSSGPDGRLPAGAPRADADVDVDTLAAILLRSDGPVAVTDPAGSVVGTVTKDDLLRALVDRGGRRGEPTSKAEA